MDKRSRAGLRRAKAIPLLRTHPASPKLQQTLCSTDASEEGIGAVLSQLQNGMEHPVMFISRKLLPPEKNYATIEKECLAVKWAIYKLRYYLLGKNLS